MLTLNIAFHLKRNVENTLTTVFDEVNKHSEKLWSCVSTAFAILSPTFFSEMLIHLTRR